MIKSILILLLIFRISWEDPNLKGIVLVARHGARNPYSPVYYYQAKLPYPNYNYGDLLPMGMRQHYLIGKYLHDTYGDFFGDKYKKDEILIRSTNSNRTIMSDNSLLLGLYPVNEEKLNLTKVDPSNLLPPWEVNVSSNFIKQLNDSAVFKDIPIFMERNNDQDNESSIETLQTCNYINNIYDQLIDSQNYMSIVKKYDDTLQKIFKILKVDSDKFYKENYLVQAFLDTLMVEQLTNTLPEGITNLMMQDINKLYDELYLYCEFTSTVLVNMSTNEFRKEIIDIFESIINNTSRVKAALFVSHDYVITHILNMVFPDIKISPKLAESIIFELSSIDKSNYQVNVIQNGTKLGNFPFQNFKLILMRNYIPKDKYLKLCNNGTSGLQKHKGPSNCK